MADPVELLLKAAIVTALEADAGVGALVADRIYDPVPRDTAGRVYVPMPYIVIGKPQATDDSNTCSDMTDVFFDIHAFADESDPDNSALDMAIKICGAVRDALASDLTVSGHQIAVQEHVTTRYTDDPDDMVVHGIATFEFQTNPSA